ncbi:MAG: LVIVD repeat-containing protein [Actinomycetota bacterium]
MRGKRFFIFASVLALILTMVEGASGAQRTKSRKEKIFDREVIRPALRTVQQHGPLTDHLPATRKNVKVVSKLRLTRIAGGISDVHYFKNHAYLGGWAPNCTFDTQDRPINGGGTYVVNVRDPQNPRRVAFIDAGPNNYVTEGVHAFHMDTPYFTGDVLIISNEACDSLQPHRGGIDIFDITNPRRPVALARGMGDTDYQFSGMGPEANISHSAMGWAAGNNAYAVLVDNEEFDDIDILDITNPRRPGLIAETGLAHWPSCEDTAGVEPCFTTDAFGDAAFHHDMWVERFGGHWHLMASYWDGGWVDLNVDVPSNPVFLQDSDYTDEDPEFPGVSPPEGNAHQGEWSRNRQFFLGSDEDFSPERFETFQLTTWPVAGERERGAGVFGFTPPVSRVFPEDQQVNGPVVWGGSGCVEDIDDNGESDRQEAIDDANESDVTLDPGEEATIVFTRGVCFFSIKVETGQMAGYDVVIIGNHHAGSGGGENPDAFICGSQGHEYEKSATGFCVGHKTMHDMFDDTPEFGDETYNGSDMADVPLGTVGHDILGSVEFDGFGYIHSFNAATLEELDTFAPAVVKKPENSFGRGQMSVHEVEADPRRGKRLGYVAWYGAGLRVLAYNSSGTLRQVGRFIDQGGNDFWGIAVRGRGAKRPLLYGSDRDFGLYIFRYTGPE